MIILQNIRFNPRVILLRWRSRSWCTCYTRSLASFYHLPVRTHVKTQGCANDLHLVLEALSGMSWSGVSSVGSGGVRGLFQDSRLRRNEGRLTTRCHVGLPPVVIGLDVLRQSRFGRVHSCIPSHCFRGRSRYVLLASNQDNILFFFF